MFCSGVCRYFGFGFDEKDYLHQETNNYPFKI